MAAIRSVVRTEDLATAFSQNQARQHVASLLGGPLGGALYAVRAWAPFAVDAIPTRLVPDPEPDPYRPRVRSPARGADAAAHQVKEGYRFIRTSRSSGR